MSYRLFLVNFNNIDTLLSLELASVTDNEDDVSRENFEKRHIGSLARLGLLPSFRFSGGRYSRSGRARLLVHSQELYRCLKFKYSCNDCIDCRYKIRVCFRAY